MTATDLMALTLSQPWATAIACLGKSVENRSWFPPRYLLGRPLLIHAAARPADGDACWWLRDRGVGPLPYLPRGAVVAVARLIGATADPASLTPGQAVWWSGPIGWLLGPTVYPLATPVACRGRQRLWRPSGPDLAVVRAQVPADALA